MSNLRMPAGWKGVRRSAEEWIRFALHDATGSSASEALAEPLIAIAVMDSVPIEDLAQWIYLAPEISPQAWRRFAAEIAATRSKLAELRRQEPEP